MKLSVIIPAYNEEEQIESTLQKTHDYLNTYLEASEIIVVDDGSRDATPDILSQFQSKHSNVRVITHGFCTGKGRAVKDGVSAARFPYCLFMDADYSTPIDVWADCEIFLKKGSRVVIASRRLPQSVIVVPQPFSRRVLGGGYRWLCRRLFNLETKDFNCGFKAYETPLAKEIYSQAVMTDWTFDVEVLCLLKAKGITPKEIAVTWSHRDKKSHIRPIKTAIQSLSSLWKLRQRFH